MAGSASEVFGRTGVQACITPLGRRDRQGSIGKNSNASTFNQRPPLLEPSDFWLWLPISDTLQADRLSKHWGVLHTGHTQHRRNWKNKEKMGTPFLLRQWAYSEWKYRMYYLVAPVCSCPQPLQLHSVPGTGTFPHHQVWRGKISELHLIAQTVCDLNGIIQHKSDIWS